VIRRQPDTAASFSHSNNQVVRLRAAYLAVVIAFCEYLWRVDRLQAVARCEVNGRLVIADESPTGLVGLDVNERLGLTQVKRAAIARPCTEQAPV
jgi:hypothetical protein